MKYQKDIKDWTLEFAISIIKLCIDLKKNNIDLDIITQLRKSGTSVGANVREGKSSISRKELVKFYSIALKSANETDFWFEIILKGYNYCSDELVKAREELKQIEKVIAKIILRLKETAPEKVGAL